MSIVRLTMAQALLRYLGKQYVEFDGNELQFFAGIWAIFGHGNLAGIGQAMQQEKPFPFYIPRNEQSMVHAAVAFAKTSNRRRAMVCTSSIGPGATNMVTGAAVATVNHLPVLLLPGDIFARRNVDPVLQQVEQSYSHNVSANDTFKPVSRFWDRISRPEQIISTLPYVMQTLVSPASTGAVVLAMPQDVQVEAYDFPTDMFEKKVWHVRRPYPDEKALNEAWDLIKQAKKPMIIAGGGVIFADATTELKNFVDKFGIPVAETHAGKGSLNHDHPYNLGGVGVTGTPAAYKQQTEADLIIAIGTTLDDFTTASHTAFANPEVKFLNINISSHDVVKLGATQLFGDAKVCLRLLTEKNDNYQTSIEYKQSIKKEHNNWEKETERFYTEPSTTGNLTQRQVIGAVNEIVGETGIVINAAGSMPADLHKLWRTKHHKQYHVEYGYSCMGYEIAGGLGIKLAEPKREVFVLVGDGSYLMMSQEITTSIQESIKLNIVVVNNYGFASIGSLSRSLGCKGYGTKYYIKDANTQELTDKKTPMDFALNAQSMGATAKHANNMEQLKACLKESIESQKTYVTVVETDYLLEFVGNGSWWDVPVAEVSTDPEVQSVYKDYQHYVKNEKYHL